MKFAIVLLAFVSFASSAPQTRKIFHDHVNDFLMLVQEEVGDEINQLLASYGEYDEFMSTIYYMMTPNFRNLVHEMEEIPEFKAVQNYLETHSIDITYFINVINETVDNINRNRKARQSSGRDFNAFIRDSTAILPEDKLDALYQQKLADDADFRAAIDGIESDEFAELFDALWANSVFQNEIQILEENGIHVEYLLDEIVALFGQKA